MAIAVVLWTGPDATTPSTTTDIYLGKIAAGTESTIRPDRHRRDCSPNVSNGTHVLDHLVNGAAIQPPAPA